MKKIPKLSICIPCFNEEKYIKECIESVLSQNFTDFVLNIVDDNSTDNTIS
ncbi:MAG: glycosyltransferase [Candidatus Levybacteria bacterium]|nr:glycosyltransferase [Candidatus Levybacteria bacterium]